MNENLVNLKMNDNYFASLPNSFPSRNFKNSMYEVDFEHQRSRRTLELRRNSPLTLQKSKTYNSKLSESFDVFNANKMLSSLTLKLDKRTHNFSDDSFELSKEDFFEKANTLIRSNDDQQICQFISTFNSFLDSGEIKARYILDKLLRSEEFIDNIIEAINNTDCDSFHDGVHQEKVKKALFDAVSLIFSLSSQEMRNYCIDAGICFSILNTLSSENGNDLVNDLNILTQVHSQGQIKNDSENGGSYADDHLPDVSHLCSTLSLYASTFNLISKLAEPSTYAQDSIISLGIHDLIADIIEGIAQFLEKDIKIDSEFCENINELLILGSCCMASIFENLNGIDRKSLFDFIPRFVRLLRIRNIKVSYDTVQILLYIVRKIPSTVYMLFEIEDGEIKQHILQILVGNFESFQMNGFVDQSYLEENEDLIEVTLKLLGNLCCSKPSEVISLHSSGLCNILRSLVNSPKLITEVLWVLSNMYEVITDQMIDEISQGFIEEIVEYSKNCNFNCKLETGYFLATIILYSPQSTAESFVVQEIIDIVVEVLGCGQTNIVNRSASAIARLVHFAQISNEFEPLLSFLEASDLKGRLRELLDDDEISVWLDNSVGLDEFYRVVCDLFETYK